MAKFAYPSYCTVHFRICGLREIPPFTAEDLDGSQWTSSPYTSVLDSPPLYYGGGRSYSPQSSSGVESGTSMGGHRKRHYVKVTQMEDDHPIRAAEFHPAGQLYGVGLSGSQTLKICAYPKLYDLREDHIHHPPTVLYKKPKHHKGPIYCMAWNATGDLLATGSSDKSIKMMRFNPDTCVVEGRDMDINIHKGTVRDLCFMEDLSNRLNLLISGGSGDNRVYITDCETLMPFQSMQGHSGQILSLYTWGGAMFVSGSQDKTVRVWDLRSRSCVNVIPTRPEKSSAPGCPANSVCVDPSGRLLAAAHDRMCMLYDIRGGRVLQHVKPHAGEVRSVRFSNKAYYLLTASYDQTLALTDLQGDLTQPVTTVVVAQHPDRVTQGRWHPTDYTFLSCGVDGSCALWGLPPN